MNGPERVGDILPRVLADIEERCVEYQAGAALARWRRETWPAQIAAENADVRRLGVRCGDRWTVCRTCRHAGERPACLLVIGPDGTGASGYERR